MLATVEKMVPSLVGLGILGVSVLSTGRMVLRGLKSRNWPRARGRIVTSQVKVKVKSTAKNPVSKKQYKSEISYLYEVNGQRYVGNRYCFGGAFLEKEAEAKKMVGVYKEGQECIVYYHPYNPELSTLRPKVAGTIWLFFWLSLVLIGVIVMQMLHIFVQ